MISLHARLKLPSFFILAALLFSLPAWAQKDTSPHSEAVLVAETTSIQPGTPFTVALRIRMEPKWHSYWVNPGDSGLATKITWQLPNGWKAGEIQWPYPHKISTPPLMTYGYENEVWLLTQITPPATVAEKAVTLRAKADWLICQESCVPAKAEVKLTLPVATSAPEINATIATSLAKIRSELPVTDTGWTIRAEHAAKGKVRLHFTPPAGEESNSDWAGKDTYFFVDKPSIVEHAAPQKITKSGDGFLIELAPSEYSEGPPKQLSGILLAPEGQAWNASGNRAMAVNVPVEKAGALNTPVAGAAAPAKSSGALTLPLAIVLAFGGGLLLNLMPCVFPVLSLKILGFVQQSGEDKSRIKKHGFAFGAGVMLSFWTLAGVLLAVRGAGISSGWGYQLQYPLFVAGLVILLFAVGLNLMGAFEIGVSLTRVSAPSNVHGYAGSFWSGVLATIVATPCVAPFMGASVAFALTQPALVALLVFTFLGLGMATPYMVLSLNPAWIKKLPRPGAWMETFKQLMAFPIFLTALWLLWVFGLQTGVEGMIYLLGSLLFLGAAIWIWRRWDTGVLARSGALIFAVLAMGIAWNGSKLLPVEASANAKSTDGKITWEPYSKQKVEASLAEGRPVLIDFTAAWCITCQVNKRTTLRRPDIMDEFSKKNVVLLSADWTRQDDEITKALESYGRNGVPTYVLRTPGEVKPEVLPEVLSPSIIKNALNKLPPRLAVKP